MKKRTMIINSKPSEISIYAWNIAGSMANAMFSVIVLMMVTRSLDNGSADIFSIAWSISLLMYTIGTFQIRTYQATDITEKFNFKQYLEFRLVTILFMMISSILYVNIKHYDIYKSAIVIIICLYKVVDALADVYEGWFQQKERLDLAGKAVVWKIVIGVLSFGGVLYISGNLLVSCAILFGGYTTGFFLFDVLYYTALKERIKSSAACSDKKWVAELFGVGLPLFINAYLMMDIINEPKMVIDAAIENGQLPNGAQASFNILFMPASVLTLAYIVFRPLLTKMAIYWTQKKKKEFLKVITEIIVCLSGIGVLVMIGCAWLGIPVLSWIYVMDLSQYKGTLLIIVLGGCFCTFSYVFDNALVVIRKQNLLVCAYVIAGLYIKATAHYMVEKWAMVGAALAYATTMLIFTLSVMAIFIVCLKRKNLNDEKK